MAMEKEALTHKIEDDLALRNRNWDKIDSHLADYASLLEGGEVLSGTLQNGWSGDIKYCKNGLGLINIYGRITAGTVANHTIICTLPPGFRAKDYNFIIPFNNRTTNEAGLGLIMQVDGLLRVRNPLATHVSTGDTIEFHFCYKGE